MKLMPFLQRSRTGNQLPVMSAIGIGALLLSGCGTTSRARANPARSSGPTSAQISVASTDLSLGRNRFTFGIIEKNHPYNSATPSITFFTLLGQRAVAVERRTAHFNHFARGLKDTATNQAAIELGGVYVAYPIFRSSGPWGAQITYRYHSHLRSLRVGFSVHRHSFTPAVGGLAPRSHNPTIRQIPATKLDSGRPPDDMHRLSIAGAIAQHKPLVVLFATAAFCTSRLCGPEISVVERLERQYRGKVNFVHIEIYKNANPANGYAPTVNEWGLHTEPWVFVVNRKGRIAAKFEGPTPGSEIVPVLQAVLH